MAAYSAVLRGASEVYSVDRVPERLAKAKEIGCIPIDFSKGDPAQQIKKLRGGREVDRGVDGEPLLGPTKCCSELMHVDPNQLSGIKR
jgi:threonine dehydrogenase-like Zn-dependent dehydrogenase